MANTHSGNTDKETKITLSSSMEQVRWSKKKAPANGTVQVIVRTHFVGNGAEIEIELSDQTSKILQKIKDRISGNFFWSKIPIPAGAKQALYAEAKLSKHGLRMKSDPLILTPAIEITNLKWDKKEARRGDILKLTADVKGAQDGTEGEIEIWEHESAGAHDFIAKFPVLVKNNKIETQWEYEYHEDTDDIPTEEELNKDGNHYNPPEYFFRVKIGEVSADSGLLRFKDWIRIALVDNVGNPVKDEKYILHLSDGSTRKGTLNAEGEERIDDIPPGAVKIEYPDLDLIEDIETSEE